MVNALAVVVQLLADVLGKCQSEVDNRKINVLLHGSTLCTVAG